MSPHTVVAPPRIFRDQLKLIAAIRLPDLSCSQAFGTCQVDDEIKSGRLHDRQIGRSPLSPPLRRNAARYALGEAEDATMTAWLLVMVISNPQGYISVPN